MSTSCLSSDPIPDLDLLTTATRTARGRVRRVFASLGAMMLVGLCARAAGAQTVRGTVVDTESGQPVPNAVVVLLDENGRRHAAVLSGMAGDYAVRAPRAGRYVLRAERVGYQSIASRPILLGEGETVVHRLAAGTARIVLQPVRTAGRMRDCTLRPDGSDQTAVAWEEARKALSATSLGADGGGTGYETRLYRLGLRLDDLGIVHEERWSVPGRARTPFTATPLRRLAATGWVHPDGDSVAFHAPDASTLLSDEFLDHHCFRLRPGEGDREGMAGLEFAPVRSRRVPDVHGILWLDLEGARLRYLEYTYTGLQWGGTVQDIGGRVEFSQAADGRWIVARWFIRMPQFLAGLPVGSDLPRMIGLVEQGGDVAGMGGGAPSVLSGTVIDTVTRLPVAGVELSVDGSRAVAYTDSTGAYRMEGVPPGAGWLRVRPPALDEAGLEPLRIPIAPPPGQAETRTVVLPRPVDVLARACAGYPGVALVGWVSSGGQRVRLAGAEVEGRWAGPAGSGAAFRAVAQADGRGVYAFCGVTPGAQANLVATASRRRGNASVRLPGEGAALQPVRIMIQRWTSRSRGENPFGPAPDVARLSGRVLDARGRGVRGATVRIGPEHPPVVTQDRGAFSWRDLPPGEYTLLVSRPGVPEQAVPMVLGSGMLMDVDVRPPTPSAPGR